MENIAIVGVAQTPYKGRMQDKTCYDLVYEVTRDALDDAGLSIEDIDNVVTVSNDFLDGRTISSMAVGEAAGAHDKNVSTVEGDGTFGAFYGAMRTLGGLGTTLVVAHGKGSEGDMRIVTNAMFDPIFQRHLGIESISSAALQANVYMVRYGLTEDDFARAEQRFIKYGMASLCFAWVPIIGDPLTVIVGVLRVRLQWFLILVTAGKFLRYVVISYLVLKVY